MSSLPSPRSQKKGQIIMRVGVPKEVAPESRVAAVPEVLAKFKRAGLELLVESGAGEASGFSDEDYRKKGASVGTREEALACPIVLAVEPPATESLSKDS
ncbi:MAG: hypothetical protein ABGY29_03580, partial [bacterium]